MGKNSGFSELNRNFKFTSLTIFLGLPKNKVGKCIKSIHLCHLWVLTGFLPNQKKSVLGKLLNLDPILDLLTFSIIVPDQVRTLAQDGTSPNMGWPNKELATLSLLRPKIP